MQALREKATPPEYIGAAGATEVRLDSQQSQPQQRLLRGYLHKTSNVLCGIKGYASLIAGLGQDADENARWARRIISEVEKMERLFVSVDGLTRQTDRALDLDDPRVVMEVGLREAARRHPGLELAPSPMPESRLMLPAADFGQVLRDVLDNAAEGPGGDTDSVRVELEWREGDSGRLALEIRDDAGGVPLQLGAQVRDPFVTGKPGHVGIGLSRVETIMDLHGLAWSLESEHGVGTTVTLEVAAPLQAAVAMAGKADDGA